MNKFELMEKMDKARAAIREEVNDRSHPTDLDYLKNIVEDTLYDVIDYLQLTGLIVEVYQ